MKSEGRCGNRTGVKHDDENSSHTGNATTVGNLDFDSLVLGASTTWEPPNRRMSAQLSLSQYLNDGRSIHNSRFTSLAEPASGYGYPSGNGNYSAVLTRLALSFGYRF